MMPAFASLQFCEPAELQVQAEPHPNITDYIILTVSLDARSRVTFSGTSADVRDLIARMGAAWAEAVAPKVERAVTV